MLQKVRDCGAVEVGGKREADSGHKEKGVVESSVAAFT